MISIEDFMEDIVGKAMRGNRISIDQLSSLSNVPKDSIEELLKGKFDEIIITSIAPHLNLDAGSLIASGKNNDTKLVEVVEIKDHPWFIGVQFHPEYKSTVSSPHPLFVSFVDAAKKNNN